MCAVATLRSELVILDPHLFKDICKIGHYWLQHGCDTHHPSIGKFYSCLTIYFVLFNPYNCFLITYRIIPMYYYERLLILKGV